MPFVTPITWAESQLPHLAELLVEQAHLEKKAAACALNFLFRLPPQSEVHKSLSVLAREELVHLERTLRLLAARGIPFGTLAPSAYAAKLKAGAATTMPLRLVDELVIAGIIESRSHERMALLAEACAASAPDVATFYRELCEAEARHEQVYLDLAALLVPPDVVAARTAAMRQHEATVLRGLPWSKHLHSGLPQAVAEQFPGEPSRG